MQKRARSKVCWRHLSVRGMIAGVERRKVAVAKPAMARGLAGFDNLVIGLGAGMFFLGCFLLERAPAR